MNLLDILSAGKRDLNEENVSSFMAWLLDPGQSHGCGVLFLKHLLNTIDKEKFEFFTENIFNTVSYRQLNPIKVDVMVEETVETSAGKRRDIDIVIILSKGDIFHVLGIENKIRKSACDHNQLKDEYEGLASSYPDAEISFLYLTPGKSNRFKDAFRLLPEKITSLHLSWTKTASVLDEVTFTDILRNILRDDTEAKIDPLSQEVRFVLKSFILFAENGFRSQTYKEASTSVSGSRTKYFKGVVAGLEGIETLSEQKEVFIGYIGGINELQKADLSQLENRPFKWDDNLDGKKASNWIEKDEFVGIVKKKGWTDS